MGHAWVAQPVILGLHAPAVRRGTQALLIVLQVQEITSADDACHLFRMPPHDTAADARRGSPRVP